MKSVKVLLVERSSAFTVELEMLLSEIGYELFYCNNNSAAVITSLKECNPDLVLFNLGAEDHNNCLDIAEVVGTKSKASMIFVTKSKGSKKYEQLKKYKPIAYLVRPFNLLTLESILEYSYQMLTVRKGLNIQKDNLEDNCIYVRRNNALSRIEYGDIFWVKSDGNYCIINTADKKHIAKVTLKRVAERLEKFNFIRVHRQYIIAISKILDVNFTDSTLMVGKTQIPIGRKYKSTLIRQLNIVQK